MATKKAKALTDAEMKKLLDDFIEAKAKENQFYKKTVGVRPTPGAPATEEQLRALDTHLASKGLTAPEAYKQFLRIYNGVELLLYPLSLLSIEQVIGKQDFIESMFDRNPGCRDFVIADGGGTRSGDIVSFDIKKPSETGYPLVWIQENGSVSRSADFVKFLKTYYRVTLETIEQEEADRAASSNKP